MYRGSLFKKSLRYAQKLNPDKIFILSAKHGLLELDTEIEPYDMTLNNMNTHERRQWADQVLGSLRAHSDIDNDDFIFLAGRKYREFLICHIRHSSVPMKGLKIGEQLKWLNEQINEGECERLHRQLSLLPRVSIGYQERQVPQNGVYVVFENGETAHNTARIVRIGTHKGEGNLPKRINEHHVLNKDRSILRKHIGRCILAKRNDPFLEQWNIDRTPRAKRDEYVGKIDSEKLQKIEQEVSDYIENNLSFAVMPVENKRKRLDTESTMISTIATCSDCRPSKNWLGLHHPNRKIRDAGLWNVQGLPRSLKT